MRAWALIGILLVGGLCAWYAVSNAQQSVFDQALAIHKESPLIDGHNDLAWQFRQKGATTLDRIDLQRTQQQFHTDIPRLRQGGVGGQFWSVYVPASLPGPEAVRAAIEQIDLVHRIVARYSDVLEFARTADDIERIFKSGRIASLIGLEGGHLIDNSLSVLRMFHKLGATYMTLTHSVNTPWADSATDKPQHQGLTEFGESVVREMNQLGMLVDLSHVSTETMNDVLRVTRAPVIFSHSSARALTNRPRNVPDDILVKLRANRGIVMVTFVPELIAADGPATLAKVADHIDHIKTVAGIDHVGIGSDFDGIPTVPASLEDVSKFPALTAELLRRGYSQEDVRRVLGLNIIRVMREAEQVARSR